MPNIAQKLCHDIVEPAIKRSSVNAGKVKSTSEQSEFNDISSTIKQNAKPTKFLHMDKKTSSKTKTLHRDSLTIIKSKTSILKSLADTAVNTLVTGPLRCDNNCVTLVRKRDHHSACKCGNKRSKTKCSAKSIQTLLNKDYSRMDKACTHCVQTATCGTQFLDRNSVPEKKTKSNIALKLPGSTRIESSLDRCLNIKRESCSHRVDNKVSSFRYVTAKRWALSNYPARGPDF